MYEFVLRPGVKFHKGDPLKAEDVKFSFERYRGTAATIMKARVAAVEIVDPLRVRFRLKQPWADFMTFFGTPATGAAADRTEEVSGEGWRRGDSRRRPSAPAPNKFVSFAPEGLGLITYHGYSAPCEDVKLRAR